jgi:hypothetical protein
MYSDFNLVPVNIMYFTVLASLLFGSIYGMKNNYSYEIYVIWYVFFFSLLLFVALHIFAETKQQKITEVLGPSFVSALETINKALTTLDDELLLAGAIVYIGIVPQLLTYVCSGLSGSATTPIYIRQIGLIAVWSIIKFLAILGGIQLAPPVAELWFGRPVSIFDFNNGLTDIVGAFLLASIHHKIFGLLWKSSGRFWGMIGAEKLVDKGFLGFEGR